MKRSILILSAALLTGAVAAPSFAQTPPPVRTEYGEHHPYVTQFDNYLDKHPEVAEQLRHNPKLIDDSGFIKHHPETHEYFEHHPRVAEAFRRHPDRFMNRERRSEHREARYEHHHEQGSDRDTH